MFRDLLASFHTNLKGNAVKNKIVVFESDDWGSIRISSKANQDFLSLKGIDFSEDQYSMYDGLEKDDDVDLLADTLLGFKNVEGKNPKFTLNTVTANPDFNKIKNSDFSEYFFESASSTYKKYIGSSLVLSKIRRGIDERIFMPQFHSREHVNVDLWMNLLRTNNKFFREAFECGIFALGRKYTNEYGKHIAATYDIENSQLVESSIIEGYDIFKQLFGFNSISYIPNNYVWNPKWNGFLKNVGVNHIQSMKYILLPKSFNNSNRQMVRIYNGKISEFGQTYAVRNCTFEPLNADYSLNKVLKEIQISFLLNKPAIVSTHRANYTSRISFKTRDKSIIELKKLLKEILKRWPNVKFLNTVELLPFLYEK